MANLDLKATLKLTDMLSGPLKAISEQAKRMQQDLGAGNKALLQMQRTLDKSNKLKELSNNLKQVQQELKKTTEDEKRLSQALAATANPTRAQLKNLEQVRKSLSTLQNQQKSYRSDMGRLGRELKQAGFDTKDFANSQSEIVRRMHLANAAIEQQRNELRRLNAAQRETSAAGERFNNARNNASNLRSTGIGMIGAGAAALYGMKNPIDEAKKLQLETARIASLGLGDVATKDAVKFAQAMKTYGTSATENLSLVRDGMTAFADEHHAQMAAPILAKMKFSNEAMYGNEHGADNEKKFMDMLKVIEMRNGLKSEAAFREQANIIQQVITATGGRVQAEEWLNVIKTGGVAAKLMDNKAFYYKMEPLVQEMGGHRVGTAMMSAYQNLYQGRTTKRAANNLAKFGLIADPTKVKHDKVGQVSFLDIGAIKGSDLFRKDQFAWMEQILVPALKARGITKEADIMDAISSIFSNRTASSLYAQMYMQRAQIHKNEKLNSGADNIDQLDAKARTTAAGQELEAKAKLHDAYLKFGTAILPIYTKALQAAATELKTMSIWMEKHPRLTKAIGVAIVGLGVGLVIFGALAIAIGSVLVPLYTMRYAINLLGISMRAAGGGIFSLIGQLARLSLFAASMKFGGASGALRAVGQSVLFVGRSLMMTPIGWMLMAIAVAGLAIYKYWQPIKAFFAGFWQGLQQGLAPVMPIIRQFIAVAAAAFAPLMPVLNWIIGKVRALWQWFSNLLIPVNMTKNELDGVTARGASFGQFVGVLIAGVIKLGSIFITFFVNPLKAASQMLDVLIAGFNRLSGLKISNPLSGAVPTAQSILGTQPTKAVTPVTPIKATGGTVQHIAGANITIHGATDPHHVGQIVQQKLAQHHSNLATASTNTALYDHADKWR